MKSSRTARSRADELIGAGKFNEAETELRQYVARFPGDADLSFSLAVCLMVKDGDEARHLLERAASLAGREPSLVLKAAQMMMTLDPEAGRRLGQRGAELNPTAADDQARLAYLRGRYAEADQDLHSAAHYLADAVRLDPRDPIYAEYFVEFLWRLGRQVEAREVSDSALLTVFRRDDIEAQRARLGMN